MKFYLKKGFALSVPDKISFIISALNEYSQKSALNNFVNFQMIDLQKKIETMFHIAASHKHDTVVK